MTYLYQITLLFPPKLNHNSSLFQYWNKPPKRWSQKWPKIGHFGPSFWRVLAILYYRARITFQEQDKMGPKRGPKPSLADPRWPRVKMDPFFEPKTPTFPRQFWTKSGTPDQANPRWPLDKSSMAPSQNGSFWTPFLIDFGSKSESISGPSIFRFRWGSSVKSLSR